MAVTKCIHRRNSLGGFVGQHKRLCGTFGCDANAEKHAYLGYWCANVCERHAKYYRERHRAELSDELILDEEAKEEKTNERHKATKGEKMNANTN